MINVHTYTAGEAGLCVNAYLVETDHGVVAVDGTLTVSDSLAQGPAGAVQRGREFAHLHPAYDGSLHLTLPSAAVQVVLDKGWGELHPVSGTSMIYGPRDTQEMEVVWQLVLLSYRFARGELQETRA